MVTGHDWLTHVLVFPERSTYCCHGGTDPQHYPDPSLRSAFYNHKKTVTDVNNTLVIHAYLINSFGKLSLTIKIIHSLVFSNEFRVRFDKDVDNTNSSMSSHLDDQSVKPLRRYGEIIIYEHPKLKRRKQNGNIDRDGIQVFLLK